MKLICEGRKTKEQVIQEVVEVYLKAYEIAARKIDSFVNCFSKYMTQVSSEVIFIDRISLLITRSLLDFV